MRTLTLSCLGPHGFHHVHCTEWGAADNPEVVVCVHGLTRNGRDFDALANVLAADYRVLCPDVVGRGLSDWLAHPQDYGYPLYLSDMAALIARSGAAHVHWVGTSMGGLIGMMLAAQPNSPIERLVMNDVGPLVPKASLERLAGYVGRVGPFPSTQALEAHLRSVLAPFGALSDEQWHHLALHSTRTNSDGSFSLSYDPAIASAFSGAAQDVVLWPLWDAVHCPTLVLRGADSDLLRADTAAEMTRRGPRAQLCEFPGIGHAPALMDSAQIERIVHFLRST